ncbi:MAG: glycosyltransferase, partial [Chloroflexota bacterium]
TWTRREVVVIEHGSDRSIESLVARHGARYGYCRPGGLGSARQEAVRLAAGEIVAFIDDDCVPAHDWLEGAVNAFREHPQAWGVQGRTLAERGPAGAHTIRVEAPDALYRTCNIAYRRDAIRAAGGFDERFVGWFEDTALGARISRHGEIVWQPDMVVTHAAMPRIPMDRRRWRILLNDERNLARYYRGFYWRTRCPGFTATVLSRWLIGSPLKSAVRELPRARSDPAGYMRLVLLLVRERAALLHVLANMVRRSSEGDGTEREPSPPAVID